MKSLRVRFAIGFSLLFTLILGTALVIIYVSFADFTQEEFYTRLKDRATTTYRLLVQVEEVDRELLRVIDRNTLTSLYDEKVIILKNDSIVYTSIDDKTIRFDKSLLEEARQDSVLLTRDGNNELVVMAIQEGPDEYVVLASASDRFGNRKLSFLKWMMIFVYSAGLLVGWLATYAFVKSVIKPLDKLNRKIKMINSESLDVRLLEDSQMSELKNLATSFNNMLERLQQSFSFRKDFVHYASHELRTPLTAMIGLTENALTKNLDANEHRKVLEELFYQQKELAQMTNSLLLLSNNTASEKYPPLRLDELLFRSIEIIRNLFKQANIQVSLEGAFGNEENMMVRAHEPLLLLAFNNLLRNAVQYSEDGTMVEAVLNFSAEESNVEFRSVGVAMTQEEREHLFTPFYRGRNARGTKGHGLGLALVRQIVELNGASVCYSRREPYNVFTITFPKIHFNA